MSSMKWVATWHGQNEDGSPATVHVEGTKGDIDGLLKGVPQVAWTVDKKAATWECAGRDNCRVDA